LQRWHWRYGCIADKRNIKRVSETTKSVWKKYISMEETSMEMKMSVEEAKDRAKSLMKSGYH